MVQNIYRIHGNTVELEIVNIKNESITTIFNKEDLERVKKNYKWYYNENCGTGYIHGIDLITKERVYLHRIIMGVEDAEIVVDHINHETLDCRRENLRICTKMENNQNKSISDKNKSGVRGVSYCNTYKKWIAQIGVKNKVKNLGYFKNFEDAVKARKKAEKKYFAI